MHPGELLREDIIPALGKSKTEIARLLRISRRTLYDILDEKQPVTVAMALRFGQAVRQWARSLAQPAARI
jgi:antitoxin HigA-1